MGKRPKAAQDAPDIEPLDVDGVRTVSLLTVLWGVAFVVLVVRRTVLEAEGNGWWLWTCLAGVGLGLLGVEYTRRRRDAIEYARLQDEAAEEDDVAVVPTYDAADHMDVSQPGVAPVVDHSRPGVLATHPTQPPGSGTPPAAENVTRPIPPHATGQTSAVTGQEPAVTGQQRPVTGQQLPVREQPPHVTGQQLPVRPQPPHETVQQAPITGQQPAVPDKPLPRRGPRQSGAHLPRISPPAKPADPDPTTGSFPRVDEESREFSAYRPRRARPAAEQPSRSIDSEDEPLLETTLGGSRRPRRSRKDAKNEPTKANDEDSSSPTYRGRRRRRDAS